MPTAPEKLENSRWTIYWGARKHPQCRIIVTAPRHCMRSVVASVARNLFGPLGKAGEGFHGPTSLPQFAVASDGPDGAITGTPAIIEWAKLMFGREPGKHIDPDAVARLEGWRARESQVVTARAQYGLDADSKLDKQCDAEDHIVGVLTHETRPGHGGEGPDHKRAQELTGVMRNAGVELEPKGATNDA